MGLACAGGPHSAFRIRGGRGVVVIVRCRSFVRRRSFVVVRSSSIIDCVSSSLRNHRKFPLLQGTVAASAHFLPFTAFCNFSFLILTHQRTQKRAANKGQATSGSRMQLAAEDVVETTTKVKRKEGRSNDMLGNKPNDLTNARHTYVRHEKKPRGFGNLQSTEAEVSKEVSKRNAAHRSAAQQKESAAALAVSHHKQCAARETSSSQRAETNTVTVCGGNRKPDEVWRLVNKRCRRKRTTNSSVQSQHG